MELWTWQTPDFCLLHGRVDLSRSEYCDEVEGYAEAHRCLSGRLGTDQFVWCHTERDQRVLRGADGRVEWVLDVPDDSIFAFMDSIVWNRILGIECKLPDRIRFDIKNRAIQECPHDVEGRRRFRKNAEKRFWQQTAPTGDWWDELFVAKGVGEAVAALIPHPCHADWIRSNPADCTGACRS